MKKRIISAIIMLAVFIPIVIIGKIYYPILMAILGIMSLYEILNLNKDIPFFMKIISYFVCLFLILFNYANANYFEIINYPIIASLFIIYSITFIINGNIKKYTYRDSLYLMAITIMIGLMFNSLIHLRVLGVYQVFYCLLVCTITDTFALFGGKMFGKHKLSPDISPNKTIEGSIIGSVLGTICSSLFYYYLIGNISLPLIVLFSFVLTIFGQMGDLFFSSIKRFHNTKDFSNIIPGHGGILDRLDSFIFVTMCYLLLLLIV